MSQTRVPRPPSPPRPPRTTNGLIGSMIICVLLVLAFVGFRALTSKPLDVKPPNIDYREAVSAAQRAHRTLVYPPALPTGWKDTSISYDPEAGSKWGLGLLTDTGTFVGLVEQDQPVADLLTTYVDDNATKGEPATVQTAVGDTWDIYSDSGGDHAYVTRIDGKELMVYGSASTGDLQAFMRLLTTEPLSEARQSDSPSVSPSASSAPSS